MSLASPKRGKQSRPVSPRRSRRLAGQPPQVDTREGAQAWQGSASKPSHTARARVEHYVNRGRPHKEYLRASLKAFLEWLPPGGQTSVARDIINTGNDDHKLWQVFHDLLSCLLYPMMAESPIPSEPESPFDFREPNLEVFTGTLIPPEYARRDGYCYCVTGHLDTRKCKQNGYLPEDEPHSNLECTNIIPCSYTSLTGSEVFVLKL
ncbi:hypothetical protein GB937_004126 [Aspergillus fischeri]|nr:hypothetical protein GB937_004126 [Aspergillus fischeri]